MAAFGPAARVFKTRAHFRLDHFFAERLQRLARRHNLHQNIRAVSIGFHHFFNAFDLALDPSQADSQVSSFESGTVRLGFHGDNFNRFTWTAPLKNGA